MIYDESYERTTTTQTGTNPIGARQTRPRYPKTNNRGRPTKAQRMDAHSAYVEKVLKTGRTVRQEALLEAERLGYPIGIQKNSAAPVKEAAESKCESNQLSVTYISGFIAPSSSFTITQQDNEKRPATIECVLKGVDGLLHRTANETSENGVESGHTSGASTASPAAAERKADEKENLNGIKLPPSRDDWPNDRSLKDVAEQAAWVRTKFRVWRNHLTSSEYMVLDYIFDRTVMWGKTWEAITKEQLCKGHWSEGYGRITHGLPLSENTIDKAMRSLIAKGVIRWAHWKRLRAYAINLDFTRSTNNTAADNTAMIPTPKRLTNAPAPSKAAEPPQSRPLFKAGTPPKQTPPNSFAISREQAKAYNQPAPDGAAGENSATLQTMQKKADTLLALQQKASALSLASAARRTARAGTMKPAALLQVWQAACKKAMPRELHHSATVADCAVLQKYCRRLFNKDGAQAVVYIEWIVTRWKFLMEEKFGWMTKAPPPALPSIKFLVAQKDKFEEAWLARQEIDRRAALSYREQQILRRTDKGVHRKKAEEEVDRITGIWSATDKLAKESARNEASQRNLVRARMTQTAADKRNAHWRELAELKKNAAPLADNGGVFPDFDESEFQNGNQ
jgi:hypothetical protein